MKDIISGKAFVYGENVDTDQIYPGRYLDKTDPEDLAKYAMSGIDAEFAARCQNGDIIVATTNFGCGSSREHAVITLKAAGVGVLLAQSFGRIFFRNAINLGLPALVCSDLSKIVKNGDELEINIRTGNIKNKSTGAVAIAEPLSSYVLNILEHGGIKPMMMEKYKSC